VPRAGPRPGRGELPALKAALPLARIYYAVKANPAAPVLDRLVGLGSCFDAASFEEVEACLDAGAAPGSISYGNTVKKESAIRAAFARGVRMFAFDSEAELRSSPAPRPGSRVYCRILVGNDGAEWPLSRKFGCEVEMASELMVLAGELGLDPFGLSFHVGSQQVNTAAYEAAIAKVAMLFTDLREAGVKVRMVNLGGGYPGALPPGGAGDRRHRRRHHGRDGGALRQRAARRGDRAGPLHRGRRGRGQRRGGAGVAQGEGRPGALGVPRHRALRRLAETEGEAIKYAFRTPRDGEAEGPVTIAGPTCDSTDTLYEKSNYRLPLSLDAGDRVELLATGAYVTSYASQSSTASSRWPSTTSDARGARPGGPAPRSSSTIRARPHRLRPWTR
jgi:ornithine decarboxylase